MLEVMKLTDRLSGFNRVADFKERFKNSAGGRHDVVLFLFRRYHERFGRTGIIRGRCENACVVQDIPDTRRVMQHLDTKLCLAPHLGTKRHFAKALGQCADLVAHREARLAAAALLPLLAGPCIS